MTRAPVTAKLRRPLAVWWTVLVAVLFSIAPTLSHALSFVHGDNPGIEICSGQGTRNVTPDAVPSVQHCPFCLHQADRLAPPPGPQTYLFRDQGGQQEIAVWQVFLYIDNTPLWAPPRGPPVELLS